MLTTIMIMISFVTRFDDNQEGEYLMTMTLIGVIMIGAYDVITKIKMMTVFKLIKVLAPRSP